MKETAVQRTERLLRERGWKCEFCGDRTSNDYQAHHCLFHRMKGRPELDEDYNLMVVCQKCHKYANSFEVRKLFWKKQVLRYGLITMLNWYNRVRVYDKPEFWVRDKRVLFARNESGVYFTEILGESALIGGFMDRPLQPQDLIKTLYKITTGEIKEVEPGVKGAMIGIIESLLGSKARRQTLLYRLFPAKWPMPKNVSTKDLTPGQWYALMRWIEPASFENPDGTKPWYGSADFITEATLVMNHSKSLEGQEHLEKHDEFLVEYLHGRFGCIPKMKCGCEASGLTGLFDPYCLEHAEGGSNQDAYIMESNQSILEIENADE